MMVELPDDTFSTGKKKKTRFETQSYAAFDDSLDDQDPDSKIKVVEE